MASVTAAVAAQAVAPSHAPRTSSFAGLAPSVALPSTRQAVPALPRLASRPRVQCSLASPSVEYVLAAAGDVSPEGNTYLIILAVAVALVGTAFPILFTRKDTCPVCNGSGFVRSGATLAGRSGRKDDERIVCQNCSGLGKINQVDK